MINIKRFLERTFGKTKGQEFFDRYRKLGYSSLQERYERFVETNDVFEGIPEKSIRDEELKDALKTIKKASSSTLAHRAVLMQLEDESEQMTALQFSKGISENDKEMLKEVFLKHDPDGRYKKLYEKSRA